MYFLGTKDIKYYISLLFKRNELVVKGRLVLDAPAGNGITTQLILQAGGQVIAGDLIPEFFRVPNVTCQFLNLSETLPFAKNHFDMVLCQEGIEHISDQIGLFKEFNRILKINGSLIITTPNSSNIRARLSYLFNESELYGKIMPPNEVDSIWMAPQNSNTVYFGHLNLIGIQRLRLFGKLAGFDLIRLHPNRINYSSLLMFPFLYPFILWFSYASYRRMKRKKGKELAASVSQCLKLAISPKVLLQGHIIAEFVKSKETFTPAWGDSPQTQVENFVT